ncbi:hypothetical protein BBJ28_00013301 [Nothophytophthora sp. Chile5]|nr:hypothetical protein BBJ28_00013301 [Nothophytophthora sp. Chile5]
MSKAANDEGEALPSPSQEEETEEDEHTEGEETASPARIRSPRATASSSSSSCSLLDLTPQTRKRRAAALGVQFSSSHSNSNRGGRHVQPLFPSLKKQKLRAEVGDGFLQVVARKTKTAPTTLQTSSVIPLRQPTMRSSSFVFATSTLLVASVAVTSAEECASNVTEAVIATIDNSTYFDTCADGVTFNVTSVFDALNFTAADFFSFCNSSTCLEPLHEMMHSIPTDCLITYDGSARNLSEEVTALHHECHEVKDAAAAAVAGSTASMSMDMDMSGMDMTGDSSASGSSSSGASSVMVTVSSLASAALLAAFLS